MTDVVNVKGVGPKTAEKLRAGGFDSAEKLAKASVEEIVELGIGKATASKIIKNAAEVSVATEEAPEAVEAKTSAEAKAPAKKAKEPKKKKEKTAEEKPKKKTTKKKKEEPPKEEPVEEKPEEKVEEPPMEKPEEKVEEPPAEKPKKKTAKKPKKKRLPPEEEVITTKKKKGVQVTKVDEEEIAQIEKLDESEVAARETWTVTARRLSKEELEARKKRQQMRAEADRITREIPTKPQPVKAKKTQKKEKTERPVKKVKEKKEVTFVKKERKKGDIFYTPRDLVAQERVIKPRGKSVAKGESKPRSIVGKGTVIGHSTSFRRSRRVIHPETLIVQLTKEFDPEALLGKKVEIIYPDTNKRVKGSVTKRFGKRTSRKVLVRFERGVRTAGLHQPVVVA